MELVFSQEAKKSLDKLENTIRQRIIKKLYWYSSQDSPLVFARQLVGFEGLYRYRTGDYRAIVHPNDTILAVIKNRQAIQGI